jgi:threonine synthase
MTAPRFSYLSHLQCSQCGERYDPAHIQTYCLTCQSPLSARYDLTTFQREMSYDQLSKRPSGMWRWHELLPVFTPENIITLGEGDTSLLSLNNLGKKMGLSQLYMKDESKNPTGTFKARGLATAISKAKELCIKKVIIPTAGNAGGAMACYARRAGLEACVIMPKDSPWSAIMECRIAGAEVILIEGLISDAAHMAGKKAECEGWFNVSTFKEPYRLEGKKVMGYEIAEGFQWNLPDVIIYPTGGGTGLVGIWKAFNELRDLGWLVNEKLPRMISVQAKGCAPVVQAILEGKDACEFWQSAATLASGLRVPKGFADRWILSTIRQSKGTAIAVNDDDILSAVKDLAGNEGIFSSPEGAATLAGLYELLKNGLVHANESILLINTGSGLKYLDQFLNFSDPEK